MTADVITGIPIAMETVTGKVPDRDREDRGPAARMAVAGIDD